MQRWEKERMDGMRRALIIGIDDYPGASLTGCVNDARKIAATLVRHQDGSPNFECKVITAPEAMITKATLRKNIEELFAQPAEVTLFYFSGHGTENNLGGYLVTPDARRYDEGVAMQEILTYANRSKGKIGEVALILDCCRSGRMGDVPALENDTAILREGVSVLTASRGSENAIENNGGGIFTSLVCEALNGGASDVIGQVTVASIYAYVDQILGAWDQRPLFKSHVSRLFTLRKCRPKVDPALLRLLPTYFPTSDYEYPLDPSYEQNKKPLGPEHQQHNLEHEQIFQHLQKYRDAQLLIPVGADHLFFAAVYNKLCKLTALGQFYWNLAKRGKI
jgi:hypothetical protein